MQNRRKWTAPEKVLTYLKGERQWRRSEKIAHSQYQLRVATDNAQKRFWEDVLRVLGAKVPGRVVKFPKHALRRKAKPQQEVIAA